MLLRILLHQVRPAFERDQLAAGPAYLRVLGFNETGQQLLKRMKKTSTLPIITTVNRNNAVLLEDELRATAVYATAFTQRNVWEMHRDYYESPIHVT